ncbi:unnamed protein product [Closterium sp. Naga37s-1]|nr:unnamed protein product [Closterium sp. Naga37s-1]
MHHSNAPLHSNVAPPTRGNDSHHSGCQGRGAEAAGAARTRLRGSGERWKGRQGNPHAEKDGGGGKDWAKSGAGEKGGEGDVRVEGQGLSSEQRGAGMGGRDCVRTGGGDGMEGREGGGAGGERGEGEGRQREERPRRQGKERVRLAQYETADDGVRTVSRGADRTPTVDAAAAAAASGAGRDGGDGDGVGGGGGGGGAAAAPATVRRSAMGGGRQLKTCERAAKRVCFGAQEPNGTTATPSVRQSLTPTRASTSKPTHPSPPVPSNDMPPPRTRSLPLLASPAAAATHSTPPPAWPSRTLHPPTPSSPQPPYTQPLPPRSSFPSLSREFSPPSPARAITPCNGAAKTAKGSQPGQKKAAGLPSPAGVAAAGAGIGGGEKAAAEAAMPAAASGRAERAGAGGAGGETRLSEKRGKEQGARGSVGAGDRKRKAKEKGKPGRTGRVAEAEKKKRWSGEGGVGAAVDHAVGAGATARTAGTDQERVAGAVTTGTIAGLADGGGSGGGGGAAADAATGVNGSSRGRERSSQGGEQNKGKNPSGVRAPSSTNHHPNSIPAPTPAATTSYDVDDMENFSPRLRLIHIRAALLQQQCSSTLAQELSSSSSSSLLSSPTLPACSPSCPYRPSGRAYAAMRNARTSLAGSGWDCRGGGGGGGTGFGTLLVNMLRLFLDVLGTGDGCEGEKHKGKRGRRGDEGEDDFLGDFSGHLAACKGFGGGGSGAGDGDSVGKLGEFGEFGEQQARAGQDKRLDSTQAGWQAGSECGAISALAKLVVGGISRLVVRQRAPRVDAQRRLEMSDVARQLQEDLGTWKWLRRGCWEVRKGSGGSRGRRGSGGNGGSGSSRSRATEKGTQINSLLRLLHDLAFSLACPPPLTPLATLASRTAHHASPGWAMGMSMGMGRDGWGDKGLGGMEEYGREGFVDELMEEGPSVSERREAVELSHHLLVLAYHELAHLDSLI